jgi:RNA polymerase sigma-54 factor
MLRSLNILQLPIGELQQLISTEIQCNPLLDITVNDSLNNEHTYTHNRINSDEGKLNFLENIAAERSPQDYLLDQVPDIDETTKTAFIILINSLDESGFLPKDTAIPWETPPMEDAYSLLRTLSPRGIGARDLQDCLQLQLPKHTPLYELVAHYFDDLEHRRFTKLQRILHRTPAELRTLLAPLKHLNFAPLKTITVQVNFPITPEIIFKRIDSQWTVAIRGMPEIRMSDLYKELLLHSFKRGEKKFFTEHQRHAQFLIQALQQRQSTLEKIAHYILQSQIKFLEHGSEYLCPQNQKQVATLLAIHPSTLSRAIKNKYVQIARDIFPLNIFFSHGNHGSLIAQYSLKERIKDIIRNEIKNMPFSDDAIARALQQDGIWLTRRTVAKYRALLRIPPANIRKYLSP